MTTPQQSILQVLVSDHEAILELLNRLTGHVSAMTADTTDQADAAEQERLREQLVIEVIRHFVAEEQYLYPLVRNRLASGAEQADAGFAANRRCERELKGLEGAQLSAGSMLATLTAVRQQLGEHIELQHDRLFPELAAVVSEQELADLGDDVRGAEQLAPTRPRLIAAANPALNKFSSVVEGFIDHVRDSYTHRGIGEDDVS